MKVRTAGGEKRGARVSGRDEMPEGETGASGRVRRRASSEAGSIARKPAMRGCTAKGQAVEDRTDQEGPLKLKASGWARGGGVRMRPVAVSGAEVRRGGRSR